MDMGAVKAVHTGNLIRVIALGESLASLFKVRSFR